MAHLFRNFGEFQVEIAPAGHHAFQGRRRRIGSRKSGIGAKGVDPVLGGRVEMGEQTLRGEPPQWSRSARSRGV